MPINVQGNPSISVSPVGTQNVKIVSWDSTASIPAGANLIGTVGISSTANTISGTVTVVPSGTQSVLVTGQPIAISGTVTGIALSGSVSVINTPTITGTLSNILVVTGGPFYQQNATAIAATGTGILVVGIQSAATTSRGWAFTTSAGGHVFIDNSITMAGTVTVTGSGTNTLVGSIPAGNQLIGTVSVSGTQSNIIVASLPAGNQIVGTMVATGSVSVIAIGTTADTFSIVHGGTMRYGTNSTNVTFAQIFATTSGDSILITSAANKSFIVLSLAMNGDGPNVAKFCSSASSTTLGGPIFIATSGVGMVLPFNQHGWIRTTTGQSLILNLASSGTVGGFITYLSMTL